MTPREKLIHKLLVAYDAKLSDMDDDALVDDLAVSGTCEFGGFSTPSARRSSPRSPTNRFSVMRTGITPDNRQSMASSNVGLSNSKPSPTRS